MSQPSTATGRAHCNTTTRRLLWWADAAVIVSVCLLIAGSHLAADGPTFAVLAPLGWAAAFIGLKVGARAEYRRGWLHGYDSATRAILQRLRGETPDVHVRAAVHGDFTPEPWDPHTPIDAAQFREPRR